MRHLLLGAMSLLLLGAAEPRVERAYWNSVLSEGLLVGHGCGSGSSSCDALAHQLMSELCHPSAPVISVAGQNPELDIGRLKYIAESEPTKFFWHFSCHRQYAPD